MKFITFEVSDRSIVETIISRNDGGWDCSILLSQQRSTYGEVIYKHARSFTGLYHCDNALAMAIDFTSFYIKAASQNS